MKRLGLKLAAISLVAVLLCQGCGPGHKLTPAPVIPQGPVVKPHNFAWGEDDKCPPGTHERCEWVNGVQHCECVPNE